MADPIDPFASREVEPPARRVRTSTSPGTNGDRVGLAAEADAADPFDVMDVDGPGAIADVAFVRALLLDAAREGRAMTYSELLLALGHRFTRPKMRALCRTLDAIDMAGQGLGEPGLAVLVVRQSDGLPGQGWWIDTAARAGHAGDWTGPAAAAFVARHQQAAFRYWRGR